MTLPPVVSRRPSDGRLLLVLLAVVAFGLVLLELRQPAFFLWDDNATQGLPFYAHDWRAAMAGTLAHLDFHQYMGQIHLGNGLSGVLYPPVYLAAGLARLVWGDLRPMIDLLAAGHLLLAALGMAVLLRGRGADRGIAFLGALVWVSLPFVLQMPRSWVAVAFVAALLPWHQLALDRVAALPNRRAILALAGVKMLFFLQGQVQWAVMLALYDLVWLLARRASVAAWGRWILASVTAGLLAAPLLLPMLEARGLSAYRSVSLSLEEYLSNSLPLAAAAAAQVFVMKPRALHLASGSIFHVGLPLLVLLAMVAFSLYRRPAEGATRGRVADLTTALAALLLSTRAAVLLYPLPVFSSFRWPFKSFLFFLFFALLAAASPSSIAATDSQGSARRRQRWLLAAALVGNVLVAVVPAWNVPLGPYRLQRSAGELRSAVGEMLDVREGRVFSLWQAFLQPDAERHLTFHWATLAGARHLGGYDPLIARSHLDLALGVEYSNIYRGELDPRVLAHLDRWGVRWLLLPPGEHEARLRPWPQLRPHRRDARLAVWENRAAWPLVSWVERTSGKPAGPVRDVDWGINGLRVATDGQGGQLRVAVAPLRWYRGWADGEPLGAVDWDSHGQMRLAVPPGTREVEVRYVNVPFRLGIAVATLVLLGWAWAGTRVTTRRRALSRRT